MIIGPLAALTGVGCLAGAITILGTEGWSAWRVSIGLLVIGINALAFAPALIKAARTGRDTYMMDEDGW